MRKPSKKLTIAIAAAGIIAVGGGTALAYWSSTGGGNGTGSTTAGTNDLVAAGDPATALVPGSSSSIAFTIHNTNATTSEAYTSVSYTVTPSNPSCLASDFTISGLPGAATVGAGATVPTTATITMANTALDQNACKSNSLAIAYTIN